MVELRLLGSTELKGSDGEEIPDILSRPKRLALLSYLALQEPGTFCRREKLVGLFWPESDETRARGSLSVALHHLRRLLGKEVVVTRGTEEIGIQPGELWVDAHVFVEATEEGDSRRAAELYRGDLLDGFHLSGASAFTLWLEGERRRLHLLATAAFADLAESTVDSDPAEARRWASRATAMAPYDERAHSSLVRVLSQQQSTLSPDVEATIAKAGETEALTHRYIRAVGVDGSPGGRDAPREQPPETTVESIRWKGLAVGLAVVTALSLSAFLWVLLMRSSAPPDVAQFPSPFLEGQEPTGAMRLSADGSTLVYIRPSASGSGSQLWVRRWENLAGRPIPGTEGQEVFFALSPDGREVTFITRNDENAAPLRVARVDRGPTRPLGVNAFLVGEWSADDVVYYTGWTPGFGVGRIPTDGGTAEALTRPTEEEWGHSLQSVLPGGRVGLMEVRRNLDRWSSGAEIWSVDLRTGERTYLTDGHTPRYLATGHLLFATVDGTLMAAAIDDRGTELGPAIEVLEGLYTAPHSGSVFYDVSETGTLVYMSGAPVGGRYEFVWVDRAGQVTAVDPTLRFEPGTSGTIGWRLSPDGSRIAFQRRFEGNTDIWVKRLPDGPTERLTIGRSRDRRPRWSPDGETVTFSSWAGRSSADPGTLWSIRVDRTGEPRLLFDDFAVATGLWSPHERPFLVVRRAPAGPEAIWALRPDVDSTATLLVSEEAREPAISRDGRWLAYHSRASGQDEVWVQPFPEADRARWQVSTDGGIGPVWARNGRELFFVNRKTKELIAVEYETTPTFQKVGSTTLFTIPEGVRTSRGGEFYDVATDDERFLMARWVDPSSVDENRRVDVVHNFHAELEDRVPK